MKIAVISEYNQFTTTGGTEYYTAMLLEGLSRAGHTVLFISRGAQKSNTEQRFVTVGTGGYTLFLLPAISFEAKEIRQEIVSKSWNVMLPVLQGFAPDLVHVHTMTTFFNIRHFEMCAGYFNHIIFTSHVPGHFCVKGDMIRNNREICNGKIGSQCNRCLFTVSWQKGFTNLVNGYSKNRLQVLKKMAAMQIHIVCTAAWQKQQLLVNQFAPDNISVIRQALTVADKKNSAKQVRAPKKIGYLGRLSPEKGSLFLLEFLKKFRNRNDFSFVLGIPANSDAASMKALMKLVNEKNIPIELRHDVTAANKSVFFADVDILLIPSFCIETGPIVLLEAVYYGKLVLAPGAGGPAEFAEAYPGFVTCYQWNNLTSALEHLEKLAGKSFPVLPDMGTHFKEKQTEFINQHLSLYNRLLKNSRN